MQRIIALKPIEELKWNIKEQQQKKMRDATNNKMVDLNPTILVNILNEKEEMVR